MKILLIVSILIWLIPVNSALASTDMQCLLNLQALGLYCSSNSSSCFTTYDECFDHLDSCGLQNPESGCNRYKPNLIPYTPAGWSDKIVISNVQGTNIDGEIYEGDSVYVDFSIANENTFTDDADILNTFNISLYIDSSHVGTWNVGSLFTNYYVFVQDYYAGVLSPGSHTLEIRADSGGVVSESNESDNNYVKNILIKKSICFEDTDQDGYGSTNTISDDGDGICEIADGESNLSTDCNDSNAGIRPGATELIGDGVDQNCDSLELCYADLDDDGYRPDNASTVSSVDVDCSDPTEAISSDPTGDCNDNIANVNPGATEICDGLDNDCNTSIDENLIPPPNTLQQGICIGSTQICAGVGGWVDDYSGIATYEEGNETTCDTLDNDCDGSVDETLTTSYYQDSDTDTYGNPSVSQTVCSQPAGYVPDDSDCNDNNASINPGATEIVGDGVDQNCDTLEMCYADMDNDSYRPDAVSTVASTDMDCLDLTEATSSDPIGDCNDSNANINPGTVEICDGLDNNCDENIDEGLPITTWHPDSDGDDYGNPAGTPIDQCNQPTGYVADNTDCNDANALINPVATEVCDGIDNNCNGNIDEGVMLTWYLDSDQDSYGDTGSSIQACSQPSGHVADNTDCNDEEALEHPSQTWYKDEDGDGYSDGTMMISCQRPENYYVASELIRTSGDPDDTDPEIVPSEFPWNMFLPVIINNAQP